MDMVRKRFVCSVEKIKGKEKNKKTFRFIGSAPSSDRVGDIVELRGWDVEAWKQNPVVLWSHDHTQPPIGKGINVEVDLARDALVFDIEFAPKEIYPFAGLIADLVDNGFMKAVSVGFKPIEFKELALPNDEDKPDDEDEDEPDDEEEEPDEEEDADKPEDDEEEDDEEEDEEDEGKGFEFFMGPRHFMKQELLELSMVNVPMHPRALLITDSAGQDLLYQKGFRLTAKRNKSKKIMVMNGSDISELNKTMRSYGSYIKNSFKIQTEAIEQLQATTKNLAHLVELVSKSDDTPPDPDDKSVGVAEAYLQEAASKLGELNNILTGVK